MGLLDNPALPPVPTAPHTRVQHIFYTAPYIKQLFLDFLETHPESEILESHAMVRTLSAIYVQGLKHTPSFWKENFTGELQTDKESLDNTLELMRKARGKLKGRRPWEYFQPLWNRLTDDPLPSRKAGSGLVAREEDPDEIMVRIRVVHLVVKLMEAEINPPVRPPVVETKPKRLAGRLTRAKKTDL
jgi:hypothetical protein